MGLEFTSFYEKFIIIGDVSVVRHYLYMKIKHAFFLKEIWWWEFFFQAKLRKYANLFQ